MTAKTRCADASEARAEPLYGTASVVRRWLLVEQPGSWGFDALTRLPDPAGVELRRRARAAGVRLVLIRRGARFAGEKRQCYFVRTQDCDHPYMATLAVAGLDELLDVDLSPLAANEPIIEASERIEPVFLVCTHGRHDACCSIRGNQVARIACATEDVDAWECSHIGGDRFAANLVCFPHGIYYGRVGPADVSRLVDRYRAGGISLDHYRGRCCYPFDVQAAEYFVRRELNATGVEDVSLTGTPRRTSDSLFAEFAVPRGATAQVEIRLDETPSVHLLTCGSDAPSFIPRYELVSFAPDGVA